MVRGGSLIWSNPAFDALAYSLGKTAEALALACVREAAPEPPLAGRVTEVEGNYLIELFPPDRRVEAEPPATRRDGLTGVLTRSQLEQEMSSRFVRRAAEPFALVFLDLDDFKAVNDRLGHLIGDACLREVGARLVQAVRSNDVVGRFGGDEFVLLLPGVTQDSDIEQVARRLRDEVARPVPEAGDDAEFGVSLGVAYSVDGHPTVEAMLDAADRAMYREKRANAARKADVADSARLG